MTKDNVAPLSADMTTLVRELRREARLAFLLARMLQGSNQVAARSWTANAVRMATQATQIDSLMLGYIELNRQAEHWARIAASPTDYVKEIINNRDHGAHDS